MKIIITFFLLCCSIVATATVTDSTIVYALPDSVKAIQFLAEINVQGITGKKEVFAGISTDAVSLSLEADKMKEIVFGFPKSAVVVAKGIGTDASEKGEVELKYDWVTGEPYKLLISVASDSAENFSLYSGYIFLPKEKKWKLIGTCKITGRWTTLQQPSIFYSSGKKAAMTVTTGQVWCQRSNGTWRNMTARTSSDKDGTLPSPTVNLYNHADSIRQREIDTKLIEDAIASGKTDAKQNEQGVYYTIMKEGTGKQVSVNDTVIAHYKGYLFENGQVFDQTQETPATFPLKRLIKAWQIAVPLCKVGGKIKLVIPSDMAYSIRTRAAKIPPNSILVFEIEVVEVKASL
ncbi:MAG TPA: FKBP-type peptidyl-prolyl cis-trans isomerase [Chitinophagaceae bacterium]|nr:FKBP-type peptidyl-prolyl cis-trans isomerase [Chitinophagaceae bacterium]